MFESLLILFTAVSILGQFYFSIINKINFSEFEFSIGQYLNLIRHSRLFWIANFWPQKENKKLIKLGTAT